MLADVVQVELRQVDDEIRRQPRLGRLQRKLAGKRIGEQFRMRDVVVHAIGRPAAGRAPEHVVGRFARAEHCRRARRRFHAGGR